MPKHALAPTRDKPLSDPAVGILPPAAQSIVPSNEVLLRSKIAQLESKGKRKGKGKGKRRTAAGGADPTTTSSSATGGGGSTRKASGDGSAGKLSEAAPCQQGAGEKGGRSRAEAGGGKTASAAAKARSHLDVSRRFEAQVALARKPENSESAPTEDSERETHCYSFTPVVIRALQKLYREQVPTGKRTDTLARKTRDMEASNKAMRAESEACAKDAVRLEQAAAKLHAVGVELDERRSSLLETRKAAAVDESKKRDELNASLNAIVSGISTKIKEQEEERVAQGEENSGLRAKLQALLQDYEDQKKASTEALKAQEEEAAAFVKRLEDLTAAAREEELREEELKKELEVLVAGEEMFRQRVGEHSCRLRRQEAGLKTHFDAIQRMQVEEVGLKTSVALLSNEKRVLLWRAGLARAGTARGSDSHTKGKGGSVGDELGEEELREMARQKAEKASNLAIEKGRVQARCRELQGERKRVTLEVESLVAATAADEEQGIADGGASPSPEELAADALSTSS